MAMSMRTLPVAVASQSKQAMQPLRCSLFRGVSLRQSLSTPVQGKSQYRCSRANKQLATRAFFGTGASNAGTIYEYKVKDIDGRDQNLSKYKGKALLIVNVASQCGFTPQYKELVELYGQYKKQGLEILAFPCNQFGSQEPGDNAQVKAFASKQGAKFPIMAKVDVNGGNAEPLYGFLKSKQGGLLISDIKWNFTKFLTDKEGNVVKRYGSTTTPLEIAKDIEAVL